MLALAVGHCRARPPSGYGHLVVGAYITLVANYQMERDLRRAALYSLRDSLVTPRKVPSHGAMPLTGTWQRMYLDAELASYGPFGKRISPVSVGLIDIDFFQLQRQVRAPRAILLKRSPNRQPTPGSEDHAVASGVKNSWRGCQDGHGHTRALAKDSGDRGPTSHEAPAFGAYSPHAWSCRISVCDLSATERLLRQTARCMRTKRKGENRFGIARDRDKHLPSAQVDKPERASRGRLRQITAA